MKFREDSEKLDVQRVVILALAATALLVVVVLVLMRLLREAPLV